MATGTNLFTSHEARILAHTPNNTSTFLRGDNTWTNTLEGNFIINNTSGGDCYIEIRRQNNADWRILNSGDNLYFQNNWTTEKGAYFNVLQLDFNTGHAYVKGNITASNGYLISTSNSNTVTIGSQNAGFCHIYNSANIPFIFNNTIACAGTLDDTTASLGTTAYPFHHLVLGGTTDDTMTAASTNPRITFQEGTGTQPVHLVYTDYDTYHSPAGLKIVGGTDATPAWFEVEGRVYLDEWIQFSGATGLYWPNTNAAYLYANNVSTYGGLVIQGARGAYNGIHFGNSTNYMTVMDNGSDKGFFQEGVRWAFWYNRASDVCCIMGSNNSGWKINLKENTYCYGAFYSGDIRGGNVRLTSNWVGFYASANAGGNRYGYIQTDSARMYFRKENGVSTYHFDMNGGYLLTSRCYNAVWNDYAECRATTIDEPGRCVMETHFGVMQLTTKRLEPGCKIISDTYGTCIGATDEIKTPIAVSGRVLAYPYRSSSEYPLGAAVCSAPNGTVDIMTRDEIMMYPERIIGTVSEIPTYEIWHCGSKDLPEEVKVNGRIWIYVR